jgi:hypothetical protein
MSSETGQPIGLPFTDEELAHHEAGHAVVHVLDGGTISRVSIDRADPQRGVKVAPHPEPASEADARRLIRTLLAGEVALFLYDGERKLVPDSLDRERALRAARTFVADDAAAARALEQEWERTHQRLRDPATWQKVKRVAEALEHARTIDGGEVAGIVTSA